MSPELISLLGGKVVTTHEPVLMDLEQEDPLAAARGVMIGILLSLIAWLIMGIMLSFLL